MSSENCLSLWITWLNIAIPINGILSVKKINETARLASAVESRSGRGNFTPCSLYWTHWPHSFVSSPNQSSIICFSAATQGLIDFPLYRFKSLDLANLKITSTQNVFFFCLCPLKCQTWHVMTTLSCICEKFVTRESPLSVLIGEWDDHALP